LARVASYVDFAEYYDLDHAIVEDIPFYLDLAGRQGSPVLELACGTGRVLLPLAGAGLDLHGLDVSENMLAVCRRGVERLGLSERVTLHHGDMAGFDLARKDFTLAFAALRSFMHLLSRAEQLACLQRAHAHLRPDGRLALDLIAPDPVRLAQRPSERFEVRREFNLPDGRRVLRKQRLVAHDRATQVRHFEFLFEVYDREGHLAHERVVPISLRYSFRDELEGLLDAAGFVDVAAFRDYEGHPYDGTGELIVVARRAATRRG